MNLRAPVTWWPRLSERENLPIRSAGEAAGHLLCTSGLWNTILIYTRGTDGMCILLLLEMQVNFKEAKFDQSQLLCGGVCLFCLYLDDDDD